MNVYLVRRSLAGVAEPEILAAVDRVSESVLQMPAHGHQISYLSCTYVPGDGWCGCLFAASSDAVVQLVNERAAAPYEDIMPALSLLDGGLPVHRSHSFATEATAGDPGTRRRRSP